MNYEGTHMLNKKITIAITGNPNCGKTTLFNNLTGTNHKIGNWSGVTVEKKVGWIYHKDKQIEIVDLPGAYSLSSRSMDEKIARDFVIGNMDENERHHHRHHRRMKHRKGRRYNHHRINSKEYDHEVLENENKPDIIVNIVDASNIERNLYLTLQLLEMKIPMIIALNMTDTATSKGIEIKINEIQRLTGVPVVEMIASADIGVDELKDTIINKVNENTLSYDFNERIENSISELSVLCEPLSKSLNCSLRWLCIKLLEKDTDIINKMFRINPKSVEKIQQIISNLENDLDEDSEILIADRRYRLIKQISDIIQIKKSEFSKTLSDKIDKIVLNRILGIPIFLIILFAMFWISTEVASAGIDFMDSLFNGGQLIYWEFEGIIPMFYSFIEEGSWVDIIFLKGALGGVGTVLTFLPILFLVFLILAFLEDWGYLSRAATVMDRFMRVIGLSGKAFISFILGFGCTVPAVMSARTLEDPDERWLTIMLVPFMSCGARLPVYVFFGAIFFASWGGALIFLLYLIGLILAVVFGLLMKRWKMKDKQVSTFVIELPSYHIPSVKGVMLTVWKRLTSFLKNAGIVITIIAVILTILSNIQLYRPENANEEYEFTPNSKESLLGTVGQGVGTLFRPLGFGVVQSGEEKGETNWRAGVSIFTGLFAKEAIVGTFGALYNLGGEDVETPELPEIDNKYLLEAGIDFKISNETDLKSINLAIQKIKVLLENNIEQEELSKYNNDLVALRDWKKLGSNISRDFDTFSAFLFLLFVLLYTPCIAVIGATYRELGAKWAIFQAIGMIVVAYLVTLLTSLIGGLLILYM